MDARTFTATLNQLAPSSREMRNGEDHNRYAGYIKWCRSRRKPNILLQEGLHGIGGGAGKLLFSNGQIYAGRSKKPVRSYIPIWRYGGSEMAVRWDERFNVQRFEEARWRLMAHVEKFVQPLMEAHQKKMMDHKEPITGRDRSGHPVVMTITRERSSYDGEMQYSVDEEHPKAEDEDLLTTLAVESVGSAEEQAMIDRYYELKQWSWNYWTLIGRVNNILSMLLSVLTPQRNGYRSRDQVMRAKINGREYIITPNGSPGRDETRYWPSPWNPLTLVDLDVDTGRDLLEKRCKEHYRY